MTHRRYLRNANIGNYGGASLSSLMAMRHCPLRPIGRMINGDECPNDAAMLSAKLMGADKRGPVYSPLVRAPSSASVLDRPRT